MSPRGRKPTTQCLAKAGPSKLGNEDSGKSCAVAGLSPVLQLSNLTLIASLPRMIQPDTVGIRNPAGPTRLQRRFAPSVPWLVLPYIVAVALANGVSADGWRTPVEAALTVDPTWLLPLRYYSAVSVAQTAQSIATTAALFAPIGVMVWLRRGPVPGAGIIASGLAFYLSLVIEVGRWFKSGLVPDPNAPLIAAAAAYMAWRAV